MIDFTDSLFSPKALDFLANSDARLNILHGSVRSGKTVNCTIRWIEYIQSGPPGDLAMFGKTRATLQRNVLNDLFDIVGPKNFHWVDRLQGELTIFGRRVYCYGAVNEEAESKIRGATFAGALCDECNLYPLNVWQQLMARLSVKGAQVFCNCNPDSPYHWFYTNYITNDKITNKKIWHFTMDDNPNLDPEYVEDLKKEYTGVWYDRMILGLWRVADGLIYDMFDSTKHMINTRANLPRNSKGEVSRSVEYLVGCDYGTATVMAWGLFAKFPDGPNFIYYKLSEYYYDAQEKRHQKTDSEFANDFEQWLSLNMPDGINPRCVKTIYCDPSAVSWKLELSRRGYVVANADNDVINGIRVVGTKLNLGQFYMDRSCVNTEKEYSSYQWDSTQQAKGIDKPIKFKDHTCLTGDTLVWTTEGKISIRNLLGTEGKVHCYDFSNKKFVESDYFNVQLVDDCANIYELELEDGRVVHCTADHKFFTPDGEKQLRELTTGDRVGGI